MNQRLNLANLPSLISRNLDMFCCPACEGNLALPRTQTSLICEGCGHEFVINNGLPILFWPNKWNGTSDVTQSVKSFYEENPFPNYEDIGCGTGQLSNFMGLSWGRTVFGADVCINSLSLGHEFKSAHKIDSTAFLQVNLFRPPFRPESFDLVVCNGVLHHTSDPELGFRSISKLVKKVD